MIWKESFFEGYLIAYIKLANRKRNVLVFPFCRITSEARIIGVLLIPFEKGMEKNIRIISDEIFLSLEEKV